MASSRLNLVHRLARFGAPTAGSLEELASWTERALNEIAAQLNATSNTVDFGAVPGAVVPFIWNYGYEFTQEVRILTPQIVPVECRPICVTATYFVVDGNTGSTDLQLLYLSSRTGVVTNLLASTLTLTDTNVQDTAKTLNRREQFTEERLLPGSIMTPKIAACPANRRGLHVALWCSRLGQIDSPQPANFELFDGGAAPVLRPF